MLQVISLRRSLDSLFLENIFVPNSVISLAIKCKDKGAIDKMSKALAKFIKEDPTFRVSSDTELLKKLLFQEWVSCI